MRYDHDNLSRQVRSFRSLGIGFFLVLFLFAAPGLDARVNEDAKLLASDGEEDDIFGQAVSISFNKALIGAPGSGGSEPGAAYVFRYDLGSETWIEEGKLEPSDGDPGDWFGGTLSLDGDVALISSISDQDNGVESGSAYIFRFDETTGLWIEEAKLLPSDGAAHDKFGYSVSISGDVALVGAPFHDANGSGAGAAYAYRYDSETGSWNDEQKIIDYFPWDTDNFGWSLSVSGKTALIGVPGEDNYPAYNAGSVLVYHYDEYTGQWGYTHQLFASDGELNDFFGMAVSHSGDLALVGVPYNSEIGTDAGAAYVFRYDSGSNTWNEEVKLLAPDGNEDDYFGTSVSIYGDLALIGCPFDDALAYNGGSAYAFRYNSATGSWPLEDKLTASDVGHSDFFGTSVSTHGGTSVSGSFGTSDLGSWSGSAYVYGIPEDLVIHVPADYPTIGEAVDHAWEGYTVLVAPGTYTEQVDFERKAITLQSTHGPEVTIIDAGGSGSVVYFDERCLKTSVLDGFTVTNGSNTAGGGILCQRSASPTIRHNFIIGNSAAEGGGIFFAGSDAQVIGNVFLDNSASVGGGAICCYYMTDHAARIENNFIIDNWINSSFGLGGGIYCRYGAPPMTNNFVARNSATCGGGIYCDADRDILIVNNTVTENTATHEGGGIFCYASGFNNCTITNTIVWNNSAVVDPDLSFLAAGVEVTYCAVTGGWPGTGNIPDDPLLADPADNDFHLTWSSPCRDAGTNGAAGLAETDFEGDPRPALGTADIGADEYYYHLYHAGGVVPGSVIDIRVVGAPGLPVDLYLGATLNFPPHPTQHGDYYLEWPPLWTGPIGTIPGSGILSLPVTVPAGWSPGAIYYLQALVGPWNGPWTRFTFVDALVVQ